MVRGSANALKWLFMLGLEVTRLHYCYHLGRDAHTRMREKEKDLFALKQV